MTAVSILPKSQRLPGSFGGYAWYVVGVLMLVNALSYLDRQVMSILVIPITADLGFTDTQMGLILGPAFMMLFVLAGMPMGWLADKHNRALLLAFGILTWSLGTLATGLADTYAGMLGARAAVGLGEAAVVPAAFSLITDYFEPDRRARATSAVTIGIPLGSGAALFGGGLLLRWAEDLRGVALPMLGVRAPWQIVLIVFALVGVAVALLVLTVRDPRGAAALKNRDRAVPTETSAPGFLGFVVANRGPLTLVMLPYILLTYAQVAVAAWAPTLLTRRYGADPAIAGMLIGLVLITIPVIAAAAGGAVADFLAKRHKAGPFLLVTALSPFFLPGLLLLTLSCSLPFAILGFAVMTTVGGVCSTTVYAALQMVAPQYARGRILALFALLAQVAGIGVGPLLVAVFSDRIFGPSHLHLAMLLAIVPAWFVIVVCSFPGRSRFARLRLRFADEHVTSPSDDRPH